MLVWFICHLFDSFYSNPETRVAKLHIPTGVGGCGEGGVTANQLHWRLSVESANLDFGYPRFESRSPLFCRVRANLVASSPCPSTEIAYNMKP